MAIGKNAIKRVENNGYSNVKTSAPDMENSHVIAKPDEQVVEKLVAPVEQATAAKKTATATKPVAKTAAKAPAKKAAPKAAAKVVKAVKEDGFARVSVGDNLPYYLL